MGSDNSLCWTKHIHGGAGRHCIPWIVVFIPLSTLRFLYRRVLMTANWLEGLGGERTLMKLMKLHLHRKHDFVF